MPKNPQKQEELWSSSSLNSEQHCVSQRSLGTAALKKTKLMRKITGAFIYHFYTISLPVRPPMLKPYNNMRTSNSKIGHSQTTNIINKICTFLSQQFWRSWSWEWPLRVTDGCHKNTAATILGCFWVGWHPTRQAPCSPAQTSELTVNAPWWEVTAQPRFSSDA